MKKWLILSLSLILKMAIAQNQVINLYDGPSPGLKPGTNAIEANVSTQNDGMVRLRNVTLPTLTVFKPKNKKSDAAVIICPGGGYYILAIEHEGSSLGKWYADRGITAFVLKYRLPQVELFENSEIRPLQDAQQAIRIVRSRAQEFGINKNMVGIMGFSAGGHLAANASTHFKTQVGEITDPSISVRPDFSILIYPVISLNDKIGHMGSRDNLLGKNPYSDKIDYYSNELQVSSETPKTFMVHAFDDFVNINNSLDYVKALKKNNVPAELHLYDRGGHGFSLKKTNKGPVASWANRLEDWLKVNEILK